MPESLPGYDAWKTASPEADYEPDPDWHTWHGNRIAFARHMLDEECWDAEQLLAYFEAPDDWSPEYHKWREGQ